MLMAYFAIFCSSKLLCKHQSGKYDYLGSLYNCKTIDSDLDGRNPALVLEESEIEQQNKIKTDKVLSLLCLPGFTCGRKS